MYKGVSQAGLVAGTDSDWASDPNTHCSQTGFFLKLAGSVFSWTLRAQKTIAHSATEAEYMVMSDCSCQVVWVRNLLAELSYHINHIPITGDNQGSVFIALNPVTESRSKHIDIHYHYICEVYEKGIVNLFYIEGDDNPADLFTKNLGVVKFLKFRSQLGLYLLHAAYTTGKAGVSEVRKQGEDRSGNFKFLGWFSPVLGLRNRGVSCMFPGCFWHLETALVFP